MSTTKTDDDPILIIGIAQRSGTNFLARLLLCHRDCGAPSRPVAEDHLLREAPLLVRYARRTVRRWPKRWGDRDAAAVEMERHLGRGLLEFLQHRSDGRRVVSKTPSTEHLDLYPRLFPDARLVLLVRDGRSVTESLVHGFRWSHDRAMREWRNGARHMLAFLDSVPRRADGVRVHVVKYEDLVSDLEGSLVPLLDFLGLARDGFDYDAARSMPLMGSSFDRDAEGKLTWRGDVERTDAFNPERFASWSTARHARFERVAGREQRALGYETAPVAGGALAWAPYNAAVDLARPLIGLRDATVILRYRIRSEQQWRRQSVKASR